MPSTILYEDAQMQIVEDTSANPDQPGGWRGTRVVWKPNSTGANEATIRTKAQQALAANATDKNTNDAFLAISSPNNAQLAAQVKELTAQSTRQAKEINGLIRLMLGALTDVSDT